MNHLCWTSRCVAETTRNVVRAATRRCSTVPTAAGSGRDLEAPGLVPALTIGSHPVAHRAGERALLDAVAADREVTLSRNAPDFTRPGRALGVPARSWSPARSTTGARAAAGRS
jgi:hypothetical protein